MSLDKSDTGDSLEDDNFSFEDEEHSEDKRNLRWERQHEHEFDEYDNNDTTSKPPTKWKKSGIVTSWKKELPKKRVKRVVDKVAPQNLWQLMHMRLITSTSVVPKHKGRLGRPRKEGTAQANNTRTRLAARATQPKLRKPCRTVDPELANEYRERHRMLGSNKVNYIICGQLLEPHLVHSQLVGRHLMHNKHQELLIEPQVVHSRHQHQFHQPQHIGTKYKQ
ncbi:conserved hypothetical protein [Ricinus communis]|uniref:Uncharacterized protein n=1 Tax=Ricinus communis TaxID=3988 RepID=B9SCQ4_RICCO|nr:conserved hypothetical protein [Ricinus communis]